MAEPSPEARRLIVAVTRLLAGESAERLSDEYDIRWSWLRSAAESYRAAGEAEVCQLVAQHQHSSDRIRSHSITPFTALTEPTPWRLHVGAGPNRLDQWINTDVRDYGVPGAYHLDLTQPGTLPTASCSHIYADNVVEHFPLPLVRKLLKNAFDGLIPGGRIRLCTPDAFALATCYLQQDETYARMREWSARNGYPADYPVDILRTFLTFWGHDRGYLFDFPSLEAELQRAGFTEVTRHVVGASTDPAFQNLERRDDEEAEIQLAVEAVKQSTTGYDLRRSKTVCDE